MPRSSRSKSHKQSNHSSRDYSYLDDDAEIKQNNDDNDCNSNVLSVRVSNGCLISGEKRKINANVNGIDEFPTPTKRQREKIIGRSDDGEVVNIDDKNLKFKDLKKGEKRSDRDNEIKENESERENKIHDQARKRGREHNEWPIEEEMRNIELEKELEKRMKRREGYNDKDIKYRDELCKYREDSERVSKSKHRSENEKDNKRKNREDGNRDYKHKEERHREDVERAHRHKTGRARDDTDRKKRSRDHHGGSPFYDDRVVRHKDDKDRKRYDNNNNNNNNKDEITNSRSREHVKRSVDDAKKESSGKVYTSRDHHRVSNRNVSSRKDDKISSGSVERITEKDDKCIDDSSVQKGPKSDTRSSTITPSPKSTQHNDSNGPDVEESRHRQQRSGIGIGSNSQPNWNNFPNWPYPLPIPIPIPNGFIPFPHMPPPIFNPAMQPFVPPMFGNMNPFLWRNQWNNVWESNHGRIEMKNQNIESSVETESAAQNSVHGPGPSDEIVSGQTGQDIENDEESQPDIRAETMNDNSTEDMTVIKEEDDYISRVYLSKIDVSEDLTRPEVYEQCRSILDKDQTSVSDELDCKILLFEEDDIRNGHSAIDDSVFRKAMSLYKKQKVSSADEEKSDEKISIPNKLEIEVDDKESCVLSSVGGKEVDDGSLLVLTNVSSRDDKCKLDT